MTHIEKFKDAFLKQLTKQLKIAKLPFNDEESQTQRLEQTPSIQSLNIHNQIFTPRPNTASNSGVSI